MLNSLYPIPGTKRFAKYHGIIAPAKEIRSLSEPFMGGASTSLRLHYLPTCLGEINPALRAIADYAPQFPVQYCKAFEEARQRFNPGLAHPFLHYAGTKNSQSRLTEDHPKECEELTRNWRAIAADLFAWMLANSEKLVDHIKMAGYYAFCMRACFGNVMRLNPLGTHFNVTWHIDKVKHALKHDPNQWCEELRAIDWNYHIYPGWRECLEAVSSPETTMALLDPPYWVDGKNEKMTPCYPGHQIGTQGDHHTTFDLAVDSLEFAIERGFNQIIVCNYYSPQLHEAITSRLADGWYRTKAHQMGRCYALGNSNGRRKHGKRVDGRDRPVEVIYVAKLESVVTKTRQLALI